eukprot:CAMPEP_0114234226 /NCGR_PEP_ID=MMETSP0058-20121206/5599_1 /TAXON_ID=36894 /ORGANISM="Pyramimonas parkeae, CCMP726" /LENGTH=111 /DNA_ID=CAMNT_0001345897 /DNA_START=385 /DNA_END=720 /DNA_ORIENTATION=+
MEKGIGMSMCKTSFALHTIASCPAEDHLMSASQSYRSVNPKLSTCSDPTMVAVLDLMAIMPSWDVVTAVAVGCTHTSRMSMRGSEIKYPVSEHRWSFAPRGKSSPQTNSGR